MKEKKLNKIHKLIDKLKKYLPDYDIIFFKLTLGSYDMSRLNIKPKRIISFLKSLKVKLKIVPVFDSYTPQNSINVTCIERNNIDLSRKMLSDFEKRFKGKLK